MNQTSRQHTHKPVRKKRAFTNYSAIFFMSICWDCDLYLTFNVQAVLDLTETGTSSSCRCRQANMPCSTLLPPTGQTVLSASCDETRGTLTNSMATDVVTGCSRRAPTIPNMLPSTDRDPSQSDVPLCDLSPCVCTHPVQSLVAHSDIRWWLWRWRVCESQRVRIEVNFEWHTHTLVRQWRPH